ncbi:D-glycero-beta-D-manno-heptose-7-phosphate kinase [Acidocella aminolytica]|uniref:Bifunctional protein HldE n=1 Tax=Acidocella aminolytica 101 = DSM 11237 TaxID=1120923 RepID=A0A0D6PH57_9PROT|nr:D-glycero-beta-D-manno-heptose-7-phosphate kinase [Acidocella aminolytica]GAN81007.1 ADP-heptose synthase RfaE [Acidocella aminolytica 101 = DSM 11237]GBQ41904.1 adenylyltransferase [Acidocella aminolytica 101 = DSM 11237]SHE88634.1 D-alpha,beta-D-heptose 7-phosphate 1-kinase [Acidocella aminolytica 101 = DSM 11237]
MANDSSADLGAYVKKLSRASVLVVGDAMLDRYVYGEVNRVSPEAPVPILTVTREVAMPGGAGNVVRNLTALDTSAAFVSVVGDDQAGSDLTGLIGGQERVEPWLLVQNGRTTTLKTRYIAQGQHLIRADREETLALPEKLSERLIRIALDAMAATSVTVLSDYRKGVLSAPVCVALIEGAKKLGRPLIVDPKGRDYERYRGADVLTPNRKELAEATGMPVDTEAQIVAAAQALREKHEFGAVLVTRSEDGMSLITSAEVRHYPGEAREVFDVSGAGDTVVAALAAAIAAEVPLPEAARLANIAAGIVVGKVGTAVARPSDILSHIAPATGALQKVVTASAAAEMAERWRLRGYKVGFTNGCFDLLHPGHVHLLEQCRAMCDRLIVGINSDASVSRLKGPTRPAQGEAARAAVLASLASVDLVCVFDEDTPIELIKRIRPDMLIKGADYTRETVVGADLVEGWGGSVALADLLPGHSTTATLARLRG